MKRLSFVVLCSVLICAGVFADTGGTWTNTVDGLWSDTNNWVNGIVPFGAGQTATFNAANVSVTNDAAVPVGVVKYNQGGVNMYGDPLVLNATAPKIILNSGITYFRSPVVASNGLTVTKENFSDNRGHFYARNEVGPSGVTVDRLRIKPHGEDLAPLPGDGAVINSVFTTNDVPLTLSQDGRYNQIASPGAETRQHFSAIHITDKGYLEPFSASSSFLSYITADELSGPGLLRVTGGNGVVEFGSTARFTGSITYSGLDIGVVGDASTAELKPAAGAIMHLDASDLSSLTTTEINGTNFVTRWDSQVPGNWVEHDGYLTDGKRALPWVEMNALNGLPIVNFGVMLDLSYTTRSQAPYLIWKNRRTDIKAAFAVLRSQNFIFTDINGGQGHYHHWRDKSGADYRWDQRMLVVRNETYQSFKNGEHVIMVNDTVVSDPFSYRLSATEFDVVAMATKEGATTIGTIAHDRAWRYGGQQVAEEIFYNRVLTDAEIQATVAYLRAKWQGVAVTAAGNDAPAHLFDAVNGGRLGIAVESNAFVSVDSFMGLGSREIAGGGTVRAERGALRPETPLSLNASNLELVNAGDAVDSSLGSLNISGMYFHLDASDTGSMTLDGDKVLVWNGGSNVTNGLCAYAMNTVDNPAPILRPGRLNGLPVVDFGNWQSGMMLHWNHTNTSIRTLFMVFDHIYRESFWLSDVYDGNNANFHRGTDGSGMIFHTGYVAGGLTSGQVHVNGKRVDQMATYVPEEEPFLISFTCTDGSSARAACMAADRYPHPNGLNFRTGGQRIAEVVIYNRHLSTAERKKVEGYLMRKWFACTPAGFVGSDESQTFDAVQVEAGRSSITVDDAQDAVLGSLDGEGDVEKLGAGTLAVGTLAGLAGQLTVKEGALRIAQRTLPDPYTLPGDIAFHVDASDVSSIHLDSDGTSVTNISDASGGPRYATPADPGTPPQLLPGELNGKPVISFRTADSGCAALWDEKITGVQTVFWVLGSQEGGGMPLGTKDNADGSYFKRSPIASASDPIWAADSSARYGVTRINGAIIDGLATGFNGGYQLMSLVIDQGCIASAFATHKNIELFGGQRLAEVIIYDRLLLDQERRDVEAYLARKWFGAPTSGYAGGNVQINHLAVEGGDVELPEDVDVSIASLAGTLDLVKDGSGILSVSELAELDGAVIVSNGTFKLSGVPAIPDLPESGLPMHMDASVTSSFPFVSENGTNFITRWDSLAGSHYAEHDGISKRPWLLDGELNGLPIVEFGPYFRSATGSASDAAYLNWDQEISSIRSGFFVLGSQAGGNFLVGSKVTGHFHRGYGSNEVSIDAVIIAEARTETPEYLTSDGSYWSKDSVEIDAGSTALSGGYESFFFSTDPADAPANAVQGGTFARDRTYRWGGQRLAEFVIYDRILTEEERRAAEVYMRAKWFGEVPEGYFLDGSVPLLEVLAGGTVDAGGQARSVGTLRGDGVVSNGTLVVTDTLDVGGDSVGTLGVDGLELASGCVVFVDISGGSADSVSAGGTVTFGSSGTVEIRGDTSAGSYDLFVADAVGGAANLGGWQVTGLPTGMSGKLQLSGSTVVLAIHAQGTVIMVR